MVKQAVLGIKVMKIDVQFHIVVAGIVEIPYTDFVFPGGILINICRKSTCVYIANKFIQNVVIYKRRNVNPLCVPIIFAIIIIGIKRFFKGGKFKLDCTAHFLCLIDRSGVNHFYGNPRDIGIIAVVMDYRSGLFEGVYIIDSQHIAAEAVALLFYLHGKTGVIITFGDAFRH